MVGIDVVDGEVAVGLVNVCSEKVLRWVDRNTKQLQCGLTKQSRELALVLSRFSGQGKETLSRVRCDPAAKLWGTVSCGSGAEAQPTNHLITEAPVGSPGPKDSTAPNSCWLTTSHLGHLSTLRDTLPSCSGVQKDLHDCDGICLVVPYLQGQAYRLR
jgi:hypothetical protein